MSGHIHSRHLHIQAETYTQGHILEHTHIDNATNTKMNNPDIHTFTGIKTCVRIDSTTCASTASLNLTATSPATETSTPLTNAQLLTSHKMDLIAHCSPTSPSAFPGRLWSSRVIPALNKLSEGGKKTPICRIFPALLGFRGQTSVKNRGKKWSCNYNLAQVAFILINIFYWIQHIRLCFMCSAYWRADQRPGLV